MTRNCDALPGALAALVDLVHGDQRAAVAELQRRVHHGVFRVLVVGEAKRGKSTLLNALLGRAVLPTGVLPLTAITTTLAYGDAEEVEVGYLDGRVEVLGIDALPGVVTEDGNPRNQRGVATVTVRLPLPLLAKGLELVDTPGTGSVYAHNTTAATTALERMDAAIFVVSVDPPISASERSLLDQLRAHAVAFFCVLNKVDYLSPEDAVTACKFTARILATDLRHEVPVWPVCARRALAARHEGDELGVEAAGLTAFEAAFSGYLAERQDTDLVRSAAGRAARMARGVAEEAAATLAGLRLSGEDLQQRLTHFTDRLEQVEHDRRESSALAAAELERLLLEMGRRRVAVHVVERSGLLLDRQIGRARADFQNRLAETRRLLLRELDGRFDTGAGRITEAVRRATVLQGQRGEVAAVARADLHERLTSASTLAEQLGRCATSDAAAGE